MTLLKINDSPLRRHPAGEQAAPTRRPSVLHGARVLYLSTQLVIFVAHLYTFVHIRRKKDMTVLSKANATTVYQYDCQQWRAMLRGQILGLAMVAVMHLYFKLPNPLLIQSILPLKTSVESKLVQIHVFGTPVVGEPQRPWKTSPGLAGMWRFGRGAGLDGKVKSS
ncbi:hypothetical protein BAUCODRAFT_430866 [Baudoinia panamericana UAMH 10762]|uniref:Uncharacterized protein n=1 Tax=Baudoinia panamericana (strain UAMH 10762) TaxID=717646 RepID=M2MJK5_BAUPA|nr:uncharacterized protein BAUCODRAFT_430866 [Baudoinia panamericana UAMH 10762]EMC96876.1 hypothetical protein BAUCODRAFT_430866 [Baudoinia panamericana UAMH 10762]